MMVMDIMVNFAAWFMNLFRLGGEQFVTWVTDIIPMILMILVLMNAITSFIGAERIERLAGICGGHPLLRYLLLPFLSAFILGNPMALSVGKFLPEFYKPCFYAAVTYHCHTNSGIFPHINTAELFIYFGIANGIATLGLDMTPLAVRYLLVGLVVNFISGYVTEFTTRMVEKQQGVHLSRELKVEKD